MDTCAPSAASCSTAEKSSELPTSTGVTVWYPLLFIKSMSKVISVWPFVTLSPSETWGNEAFAVQRDGVYADVYQQFFAVIQRKAYGVEGVEKRFNFAVSGGCYFALGRFDSCAKTKYALRECRVGNVLELYSLAAERRGDNAVVRTIHFGFATVCDTDFINYIIAHAVRFVY